MNDAERLIDELTYNANVAGSRPLERRLADLSIWYYKNRSRIPRDNLAKRADFLEKALWISIEIQALLLERIRSETGSQHLWLPRAMLMDQKEFG